MNVPKMIEGWMLFNERGPLNKMIYTDFEARREEFYFRKAGQDCERRHVTIAVGRRALSPVVTICPTCGVSLPNEP